MNTRVESGSHERVRALLEGRDNRLSGVPRIVLRRRGYLRLLSHLAIIEVIEGDDICSAGQIWLWFNIARWPNETVARSVGL